jgi:DamX protein
MQADTWWVELEDGGQRSVPHRFDVLAAPPPPAPVAAPKPAVASKPAAAPAPVASAPRYRDAAWLKLRSPAHFGVQLVAAGSEEAIHAHLRGHTLPGELALVRLQRSGQPWWVLFWGDFAERAAAERAVAALPPPLRRVIPWVRPYADIQRELDGAANP